MYKWIEHKSKFLKRVYTFGFKSLTPFDKVRFPGFA